MSEPTSPDLAPAAEFRISGALVLWLYRVTGSLLAGSGVALLAGATLGSRPAGDATLFEPGGLLLLDWLRANGSALGAAAKAGALVLFATAVLGQIPLAAVLHTLHGRGPGRWLMAWQRALAIFPRFVALSAAVSLAQGLLCLLALLAQGALAGAWPAGELASTLSVGGGLLLAVPLALALGALLDLARATLIQTPLTSRGAFEHAFHVLRSRSRAVLKACLPSAVAPSLLVLGAALLSAQHDWHASRASLFALLALHQLVLLLAACLRVFWLSRALRLTAA